MSAMQTDLARSVAPPDGFSAQLADLLAEARAALKFDPSTADRCLNRCELLLLNTPSAPSLDNGARFTSCGGLAPWQTTRVERHVDANLTARLSTADLAALVRLSENHFARAFKTSIGCPPHAYVVQRRIMHAKALMIDTDTPLSQVALDCGLADQAHLSRLFRRLVGDTPSAWRRLHRVPQS